MAILWPTQVKINFARTQIFNLLTKKRQTDKAKICVNCLLMIICLVGQFSFLVKQLY